MAFIKFNKDKQEALDGLNQKSIFGDSENDKAFSSKSIFDDPEDIDTKGTAFSSGNQLELKRDTKQFEGIADIIAWSITQLFVVMTNCLLSIKFTVAGMREIIPTMDFIDFQNSCKKISIYAGIGCAVNLALRFFFTENENMMEVLNTIHNSFIMVIVVSLVSFILLFIKNTKFSKVSFKNLSIKDIKLGVTKKDKKNDSQLEEEEINLDGEIEDVEIIDEEDEGPKDEIDEQVEKDLQTEEKQEQVDEFLKLDSDYEKTFDDIMAEILGPSKSEEDTEEEEPSEETSIEAVDIDWNADTTKQEPIKIKKEDDATIAAPLVLNRKSLFESFYPLFTSQNPTFDKIEHIDSSNSLYGDIITIISKAIGNMLSKPVKECVKLFNLLAITNKFLSTEIIISRPKKVKINKDDLAKELTNYSIELLDLLSRKDMLYEDDRLNKVSIGITIQGDNFQIVIEKPNKNAVLLGDVYKSQKVRDYMENTDVELPFIVAVDSLGNPVKANLKDLYYGTIGGPPRSGKTWLLGSTFIQLAITNTPTDIQFIFVNPKPDDLFKSAYMLPHTARLIEGDSTDTAYEIYDLICRLEEEITKRQELFSSKGCANIWEYKELGGIMPALFVQLDEYMTIRKMMDGLTATEKENEKELPKAERKDLDYLKSLDGKMKMLLTRAPSSGIFVHIVSHVFTGVINKQDRLLTPYKVVIRSADLINEVFDPSELKNFGKSLINPGDAAVKLGTMDTVGGKTLGIHTKNISTNILVKKIAKAYYSMPNIELADEYLKTMGPKFIKDHEDIKEKLKNI